MGKAADILKFWKKEGVKFVDFRFTDLIGGWHQVTRFVDSLSEEILECGIVFDGSSITGWRVINNSDMILKPDLESHFLDPFTTQLTAILTCVILNPEDGSGYERDPRTIAMRAVEYLKETDVADTMYTGTEMEFFVFDDVRFGVGYNEGHFIVDSEELPSNCDRFYESGNKGHRPGLKGGYLPVSPVDSLHEYRSEVLSVMKEVGLLPRIHHHEVASGQCEIGFEHSDMLSSADNVQKAKYVVKGVANSCGRSATFMPKPVYGDNGSGMHCHVSLWKDGTNLFAGDGGRLSETALFFIGGILKHGKSLSAFTNASTNSYRRLRKGYEAPVNLVYSYSNRSAAIRIPHDPTASDSAIRIELRFPDAASNSYLASAAILMAGMDGIQSKIDPIGLEEKGNMYERDDESTLMSRSLEESLDNLELDNEFLQVNSVFSEDMIEKYIKMKREECDDIWSHPQPAEFKKILFLLTSYLNTRHLIFISGVWLFEL